MSTNAGLLQAILDDPRDDGVRLVYADYLEERGREGDLDRANFIRAQIALAHLKEPGIKTPGDLWNLTEEEYEWHNCCGGCRFDPRTRTGTLCAYHEATRTERSTLARGWPKLWSDLWPSASHDVGPYIDVLARRQDQLRPLAVFTRGFVEQVCLREEDWLTHGARMIGLHPIRKVRLLDREPQTTQLFAQHVALWRQPISPITDLSPEIYEGLTCKSFWVAYGLQLQDCSDACLAWAREQRRIQAAWRKPLVK